MVFIHGGAFRNGASSKPLYDGKSLAALGNVVVVSMNYRLGSMGFLAHPGLSAEDEHGSSGNYGLLDQRAALRWVQTNIAAFGGNPDNVTIFGESAGSMSVCTHLASPLSAGLFRRAIGESGSCLYFVTPLHTAPGTTMASAESRGAAFAKSIGCDAVSDAVACLRAKSAAEIVSAPYNPEGDIGFAASMPQPNIDGYLLVESPASAFLGGRVNAIDAFIGGTNQDEATFFTRTKTIATVDDYRAEVGIIVPAHVDDVLALYPADGTTYATPKDAYDAFVTDLTFVCPTRTQLRLLALRGIRTYQYQFEKLTPFGRISKLGVFHASELPFVFGNLTDTSGTSATDRALATAMGGAWTRFAKVGDPNDDSTVWPARTANADVYLRINDVSTIGTGLHQATCDAMTSWFP